MVDPKISIIIPVYNTEKWLYKCIYSAVNQTYKDIEVICVDDGSTDNSGRILDEFLEQYTDKIKVIHQNNYGESRARNVGLQAATGQFIGFMDCDDWIELDTYQTLYDLIKKTDADISCVSWFKEYPNESLPVKNRNIVKSGLISQQEMFHYVYKRDTYQGFAYMWDKLYKKEVLTENNKILLFDESLKLGGDVIYLAQALLNIKSGSYCDKHCYHYRMRKDSGSHDENVEKRMDGLKAYEKTIQMLTDHNVDNETLTYVKRFISYHSSNVAEIAYRQKDKNNLEKCQSIMRQYQYEYESTNQEWPERIERYHNILQLTL